MVTLLTSAMSENGGPCGSVAEAVRLLQSLDKQWFERRQGHTSVVARKPLFDLWLEGTAQ